MDEEEIVTHLWRRTIKGGGTGRPENESTANRNTHLIRQLRRRHLLPQLALHNTPSKRTQSIYGAEHSMTKTAVHLLYHLQGGELNSPTTYSVHCWIVYWIIPSDDDRRWSYHSCWTQPWILKEFHRKSSSDEAISGSVDIKKSVEEISHMALFSLRKDRRVYYYFTPY